MSSTTWESRPELPEGAPAPAPVSEQRWQWWMAPVALILALVIATIGYLVAAGIGAALGHELDGSPPPGVVIGATFAQDLAFVGIAILLARLTGPTWAAQFGLRRAPFWKALGWMAVFYLAYVALSGIYQQFVKIDEETDLLRDLGVHDSTGALVGALITVCVLAPVVEEFFFRGFFFTALRNKLGTWLAAIATGAIFGAIHYSSSPVEALVPLAVLGALLCLLYAKTGSLYPCIAAHAINNAIAFGYLMEWDWQIPLLLAGSLIVCFGITVPIARRWRPPRPGIAPAPAAA